MTVASRTPDLFHRRVVVRVGALDLRDLDVAFEIERTLKPEPNTCSLKLYNLNGDHRSQVESLATVPVIVEAGYRDAGTTVLFHGDLRNVQTTREGPDLITSLESGDGEQGRRQSRVNRSFSSNTSVEAVLRELARAMQVGIGNAIEAIRAVALETGPALFRERVVLSGGVAAELEQLLRSCGLEYSIQGGALQVLRRGQPLVGAAVLLSPSTGLIDSPVKELDDRRRPIVTARCLIVPDLYPGRLVRIESERINGQFRVEAASYKGDTAGPDWSIDLTLRGAEASAAARRAA